MCSVESSEIDLSEFQDADHIHENDATDIPMQNGDSQPQPRDGASVQTPGSGGESKFL